MYDMNMIFIYGLLITTTISVIGIYLISRGLSFLSDILGHAYLGAYILFSVISKYLSYFASFLIAFLMSKEALKEDEKQQVNIMLYYIFFTVLLLSIVSLISPESLNMIVFGNILSIDIVNMSLLVLEIIVWILLAYKYRKEIFLSIINKELSSSVYENVEKKEFVFVFFSLLILMHAISVFGILLTAAITLLPYLTFSSVVKGLRNNIIYSVLVSFISYAVSFYISLNFDISISVALSSILLGFYFFISTIKFLNKKLSN